MLTQCSLCARSKLNKCTLYHHPLFFLFSIIYMVVVTKLRGRPCTRTLSRDREQATTVSELDSVGACLEGLKLLFRAHKMSKKYHDFAVSRATRPALLTQGHSLSKPLAWTEFLIHSQQEEDPNIQIEPQKDCSVLRRIQYWGCLVLVAQRSGSGLPLEGFTLSCSRHCLVANCFSNSCRQQVNCTERACCSELLC